MREKKSGAFFPCGKCYDCKARRVAGWSFRLMREDRVSTSSYFITLTYDVDHVAITPNRFLTLEKRSFQLFMKRLRKLHVGLQLKYYCAGEYGGESFRPHYHMILFNADLKHLIGEKYARQVELGVIPLDGKHQFDCPVWGNGYITIGLVSEASVGYTLKYISKPPKVGKFARDDREREFCLISKGIGADYVKKFKKWHKTDIDNRMFCTAKGGIKLAMPRYYKEKIYNKIERGVISLHMERMEAMRLGKLSVDKLNLEYWQEYSSSLRKTQLNSKDLRSSLKL